MYGVTFLSEPYCAATPNARVGQTQSFQMKHKHNLRRLLHVDGV